MVGDQILSTLFAELVDSSESKWMAPKGALSAVSISEAFRYRSMNVIIAGALGLVGIVDVLNYNVL